MKLYLAIEYTTEGGVACHGVFGSKADAFDALDDSAESDETIVFDLDLNEPTSFGIS